jgi:hypothetical protein
MLKTLLNKTKYSIIVSPKKLKKKVPQFLENSNGYFLYTFLILLSVNYERVLVIKNLI